ncbi:exodeoxyribonuclease V subunit gamma [Chitinibacter bivalviorum]|uniref:RecBCD enzyme subunit RecC n=1 Tax=Chitinibacter bivalviorum TaxID=2739434 RepID=A0A7H9BFH3_9NEIS|nr:exodeoxyribonuclease V subunit gamma [Chitinibacter bivalviorum]QLG87172.1 exodeoxyribonuclease V subunit gamma [Chitinibacter bivalviorum]
MTSSTSRLNLFQSNRLENLFELMQALFAVPLSDPFANEKIIVSSKGMERWLRFQLAQRVGICSGVDFALPAGFIWRLLQDAMPGLPADSPYSSSPLAWRLFGLLPESQAREASPIVAAYLAEGDARRRMALAGKLADVFDQYLVFRSDWIAEWEAGRLVGDLGPDEAWQATLWRELRASIDSDPRDAAGFDASIPHRAEMFVRLFAQWGEKMPQRLPERLTVFGVSGMPPAYIDVLGALSEHIDVNLFLLNPCREDWGAIVSPKAVAIRAVKQPQEALYLDIGHPLLASMGKAGRDFFRAVTERFPWSVGGDGPLFTDPCENLADTNLLRTIQSDILNLLPRDAINRQVIAPDDRSLTFHSCHSAMREVEVLHDQLCHVLAKDSTLLASDIAVLLPDLGPYAPLIEAVFGGAAAAGSPVLPFNIADLSTAQECPAVAVFLQLFNLPDSRCKADEIFGLLETPQLAARFGISPDELLTLQHWIAASGIRWGLDEAHRAEFADQLGDAGLESMGAANTWQAGLDSLILGAALPQALAAEALPLWQGLAPWDDLEGSQVALLAKLNGVLATLKSWREQLKAPRTLADWSVCAQTLLDDFLQFDDAVEAERLLLQAIRESLAQIADEATLAQLNIEVERGVVLDWLRHRFDTSSRGSGFMSRGITFCTMVPMRGLPFRVIAVLGLNEADFPRNPATAGFDLIAQNPQLGDRSRRLDDRYLFLDILLAARDALYLSWVGRGVRDNEAYPPSVLVSDLIDCVQQGFSLQGNDAENALIEHISHEYSLQVFSPIGFEANTQWQSFNPLWCAAAQQLQSGEAPVAPASAAASIDAASDVAADVMSAVQIPTQITMADLAECLAKPAAFYLRQRANLVLDEVDGALDDDEPFDLRDFANRKVRDAGLRYGEDAPTLLAAQGRVPLGTPGQIMVADEIAASLQLKAALEHYHADASLPVLADFLTLSLPALGAEAGDEGAAGAGQTVSVQLSVVLPDLYPQGQLIARSCLYPRDKIKYWVRHLALCALQSQHGELDNVAPITRVLSPDKVWLYPAIDATIARQTLADLLQFYRANWLTPQPFFAKTALKWIAKEPEKRWDVIADAWLDGFDSVGEYSDAAIQLLWPDDPLDEDAPTRDDFAMWCEALLGLMQQCVSERGLAKDLAEFLQTSTQGEAV